MKEFCYTGRVFRFLKRGWAEKPELEMSQLDANCHPEYASQLQYEWELYETQHTKDLADSVVVGHDADVLRFALSVYGRDHVNEGDTFHMPEGYRIEVMKDRSTAYLVPLEQPGKEERTFTESQVRELLRKQRELTAWSLGLSSAAYIYPRDFNAMRDWMMNSELVKF
jgi:hypothetical protein